MNDFALLALVQEYSNKRHNFEGNATVFGAYFKTKCKAIDCKKKKVMENKNMRMTYKVAKELLNRTKARQVNKANLTVNKPLTTVEEKGLIDFHN